MPNIAQTTVDSNNSSTDSSIYQDSTRTAKILANWEKGQEDSAGLPPQLRDGREFVRVGEGEYRGIVTADGKVAIADDIIEFEEIPVKSDVALPMNEKTDPDVVGSENDKTITVEQEKIQPNNSIVKSSLKSVNSPLYAVTLQTFGNETQMYKLKLFDYLKEEQEIRPNLRRLPNEKAFYIQMLDKDLRSHGIVVGNSLITSIRLAPNPTTLTINSQKMVNRYNTMTRWVEEHWGDEIDVITFSGSSYSFFAHDLIGTPNTGLTNTYRQDTKAYKMIKELSKVFKYNGCIYQSSDGFNDSKSTRSFLNSINNNVIDKNIRVRHPRTGMVKERLYINIFYDYISFLGYFESFDIIEDSTNPFIFTYNAVFKSERTKYHQGNLAIDSVPELNFSNDIRIDTNLLKTQDPGTVPPTLDPDIGLA